MPVDFQLFFSKIPEYRILIYLTVVLGARDVLVPVGFEGACT